MKEYVCIDIGGTAIKAGVLDENARIIEQLNIPTEAMQGGSYVLARVKKIIERYIVLRKITGICMLAGQIEYMVPSIPLTIRNPNLFNNCPMYNKQFSTTWFIRHIFISHTRFNTLNNCKR